MSRQKKTAISSPRAQVVEVACKAGTTREQLLSEVAVAGTLANSHTVITFSQSQLGECDAMRAVESLQGCINASKKGDLSVADTLLVGQATALNAIFHEMARRAALNMGQHLGAADTYMRLGLKAQSQCRATLESLAKIKNPPNVAFVKQANIAHGPQQVNNGARPSADDVGSRAGKTETPPIELLENGNGEWMESGATGTPSTSDSAVATGQEVDRAKVNRR